MYKREYSHQAFPTDALCQGAKYTKDGMTLLDYFAAKAMQDIMKKCRDIHFSDVNGAPGVAHHSYQVAAAMMEERKKYLNK